MNRIKNITETTWWTLLHWRRE